MNTRNKNRKCEFFVDKTMQEQYADRLTTTQARQEVAYPLHGVNAPRMPACQLSKNHVDIETYLYGIGANNYLFPTSTPQVSSVSIPSVNFYDRPAVYIPRLEPFLENQRPL
jgi:hypothetical protein